MSEEKETERVFVGTIQTDNRVYFESSDVILALYKFNQNNHSIASAIKFFEGIEEKSKKRNSIPIEGGSFLGLLI